MPFTPFHFGPGLAANATMPKHVSFISFCLANVLTDIEPLYYMLSGQYPLHRFFHTYIGATFIIIASTIIFICTQKILTLLKIKTLALDTLAFRLIFIGAAIGSYSHVALDSIMHSDIRPLAPFSDENFLFQIISTGDLYLACTLFGIIGLFLIGVRQLFKRATAAK